MTNPTTPPSPQAALQQARDALTGWMDQPDTPAAYDASMERAIAAVAAIDAALAASQQAVAEPFELAQDAEQLAAWLENQFKRHGEIEDRLAAEMLRDMAKKWTPSALAPQAVSEPPAGVAVGWQPIATAPRDGTHILVCQACLPYDDLWTFNQNPPHVVHWFEFGSPGFYLSHTIGEQTKPYEYTHWKPLGAEPCDTKRLEAEAARYPTTVATLICAKCGVDRYKAACPQNWDCGMVSQAQNALATPTHQAAEPAASDMVMAPREPTEEIELAGEKALLAEFGRASRETWADVCGRVYRAMIAAAAPSSAHEAAPVPEAMEVGEDTKRLDWLERESGEDIDNVEVWACWPAKHDRLRGAIDAARAQQSKDKP